jgi:hypothetical protein
MISNPRMSWTFKYFAATCAYGLSRSIPLFWNKEKRYANLETNKFETRPMPFMEKTQYTASVMGCAPCLWPVYVFHDARRIEFYLKGLNPRTYGIDTDSDFF